MLAARKLMRARSSQLSRPALSIFTTLRGGMQSMVDALAARLNPAWVRTSTPVRCIEKLADGWKVVADGHAEHFDAVIIATPAWAASELLRRVHPALSEELEAIPYSSSITVNLIYEEAKMGRLPQGFGIPQPSDGAELADDEEPLEDETAITPPTSESAAETFGGPADLEQAEEGTPAECGPWDHV